MGLAIRTCALALSLASVFAASGARAADLFSDNVCPRATEPVRTFDALKLDQTTPVDVLIASLRKIMDVYNACAAERLTDSAEVLDDATLVVGRGIEGSHYAQVREAQFAVVEGRLHRLLQEYGPARAAFERAANLVENTIQFKQSSQTAYRSNNVHFGSDSSHRASSDTSNYREAAMQIRDVARAELARTPKADASLQRP